MNKYLKLLISFSITVLIPIVIWWCFNHPEVVKYILSIMLAVCLFLLTWFAVHMIIFKSNKR